MTSLTSSPTTDPTKTDEITKTLPFEDADVTEQFVPVSQYETQDWLTTPDRPYEKQWLVIRRQYVTDRMWYWLLGNEDTRPFTHDGNGMCRVRETFEVGGFYRARGYPNDNPFEVVAIRDGWAVVYFYSTNYAVSYKADYVKDCVKVTNGG